MKVKILAPLFTITYIVISIAIMRTKPEEVYPFFSWFVFVDTPSRQQEEINVIVHSYGDTIFSPPKALTEIPNLAYNQAVTVPGTFQNIQILGRSLQNKEIEKAITARQQLELVFGTEKASYSLIRMKFNPIERWRNGTIDAIQVIDSFSTTAKK